MALPKFRGLHDSRIPFAISMGRTTEENRVTKVVNPTLGKAMRTGEKSRLSAPIEMFAMIREPSVRGRSANRSPSIIESGEPNFRGGHPAVHDLVT